jgi:uncharacterized protein (DUF58 family)
VLTRHGWGAALLAVVTAVVGRLFGVLELFVLGAGILALVAGCVLWTQARDVSLSVQRRLIPETLQVGEVGRVELRVTNTGSGRTAPLSLWEPVSGMGGANLRLAPLRQDETTVAKYRLPASRRGSVTFGPMTVERRDPFGISARRTVIPGTHEVVILPAHLYITLPSGAAGSGPFGQYLRLRALGRSGTEFHSLRDYIEGDDLRQIHWKASARSETLKVREVEPDGLRRCTVALDNSSTEYTAEGFERAVSVAASAVASALRSNLQLRLVIGSVTDLRHTSFVPAMRELADCAVTRVEHIPFRAPAGDGLGLSIVVTGSPQSPAVADARRFLGPNDVLLVIACTSMSGASRNFVINATEESEFAASWAALTGTLVGQVAS